MKLSIFGVFVIFAICIREAYSWQDQQKYSPNLMSNKDGRRTSNSIITRYNEEKMTYERLKKLAYRPVPKMYYYFNPNEALRYEYQALVPQTNDYTPTRYNPALFRGYHGYGFNEWGGQGIL